MIINIDNDLIKRVIIYFNYYFIINVNNINDVNNINNADNINNNEKL
jgi:hypothetical protein